MSELMSTLEFVRAYIDGLLCITKGSFEDHLDKLREVLRRLQKLMPANVFGEPMKQNTSVTSLPEM
eukprot:scaffold181967_cov46-Cyclotella_meneghiniana.AAC.1